MSINPITLWTAIGSIAVVFGVFYAARNLKWFITDVEQNRKLIEISRQQVDILLNQYQEEAGFGRTIVKSAIQTALRNIEYWEAHHIDNMHGLQIIPLDIVIVPPEAPSAVKHARRFSVKGSELLSSAFDYLRHAEYDANTLGLLRQDSMAIIKRYSEGFNNKLAEAKQLIIEASKSLSSPASPSSSASS